MRASAKLRSHCGGARPSLSVGFLLSFCAYALSGPLTAAWEMLKAQREAHWLGAYSLGDTERRSLRRLQCPPYAQRFSGGSTALLQRARACRTAPRSAGPCLPY